jgi:hypothetical protein
MHTGQARYNASDNRGFQSNAMNSSRRAERLRRGVGLAAILGLAILPAPGQKAPLRAPESQGTAPSAFRVGEKLHYRISWASLLTAATAELAVNGKPPFYGRQAWHFRALAKTIDAARMLYALDNQFDSYADPASLASFRYEAYLREQGKVENHVTRMAGEGLPVQNDGPATKVQPGTRDPLGFIYYLRTVNWTEQAQVKTPVFTGKRLFEIHATVAQRGTVTVPAGNYPATQVELRVFEHKKELPQVRMRIWLADDESRAPALMEAEMPFGKLRIELVRARVEAPAKAGV